MSIPGQDAVNRFLENEVRLDDFLNDSESYTDKNSNIIESLPHLANRIDSMTLNITDKGNWSTATVYVKNDIVLQNDIVYLCMISHTSGTFATDLAANKWQIYKNVLKTDFDVLKTDFDTLESNFTTLNNKVVTVPAPSKIPYSNSDGIIDERWLGTDIRRWCGALAPVKSNQGSIVIIGDSISEGYGASNAGTKSWVSLLRNALFSSDGENCLDTETVVTFFGIRQYGLTYAGTYAQGTAGPTKQSIVLQPGASISFTGAFDFVDVFYTQSSSSGSILFKKDGTTYKTLSTSGSAALDVCSFPSSTAGGGLSHTYSLEASGAAVEITGLIRLQSTASKRIHFTRQALSGQSTTYFSDTATLASITKQGSFYHAPSFYIISLGTNDIYNSSVHNTPEQYETNLRNMCAAIYTAHNDNRIALVIPAMANETAWPPYYPWGNYVIALRRVAADFSAVVIDLGSIDFISRGLTADGVHPDDTGHFLIFQKVMSSIADHLGNSDENQVRTSFTPTFARSGGTISVTYGTQTGWYVRNRGLATFSARIVLNAMTTDKSGYLYITLPFISATTDALNIGEHCLAVGSGKQILAETIPGQAKAVVRGFDPATGAYSDIGTLTSSSAITIGGTIAIN